MSKASLPKLGSLCILAAVVGKLQVLMDESLSKSSTENIENFQEYTECRFCTFKQN